MASPVVASLPEVLDSVAVSAAAPLMDLAGSLFHLVCQPWWPFVEQEASTVLPVLHELSDYMEIQFFQ